MIKIGMIGIAAVFLALLLKKEKGELALLVGIAASVLIFGYTLSRISFILDFLRELMDTLPVDPALLKALLKMLGITYVADFSASVCREAGYGSVAGPNISNKFYVSIRFNFNKTIPMFNIRFYCYHFCILSLYWVLSSHYLVLLF